MDELVIRSEQEYSFRLHSKNYGKDGWIDSYLVDLTARDFAASFEAGNHPAGTSPEVFFAELAQDWSGWKGAKQWASFEQEFQLSATTDLTGHVTLVVQRDAPRELLGWSATFSLMIEAGQLAALADGFRTFFTTARGRI